MAYTKLFRPIKIGPVEIRNRIAMAPMNTLFSENNLGYVFGDQIPAYYAARAKGGTGLIITEAVITSKESAKFPAMASNPHLYNVSHIPGMTRIIEAIHAWGAKVFVQLIPHLGRQASRSYYTGEVPPAPSAIPYEVPPENVSKGYAAWARKVPGGEHLFHGEIPREMTIEEILQMEEDYANSVTLAGMAGFDGVEIHAAHGYLLHEFLSPRSNQRTDLYGGTLENRMRFLLEITKKALAVRDRYFPEFAVTVSASADEHVSGGFTHDQMKIVVKNLANLGVDAFHLTDGSTREANKYTFPDRDGTMLEEAEGFKKTVSIPIITPSVHDPRMAEEALDKGRTDMISLGRQLLADPEWAIKVKEDRISDIVRCVRDNICLTRFRTAMPLRCSQNPNLGREQYMAEYWPPPVPRKGDVHLPKLKSRE